MAVGCGGKCARVVLIIYNIIFLLSGLCLIALGIWLVADGRVHNVVNLTYNGTNSTYLRNAAIILITMGVLVLIVSLIGFIGAITENVVLLSIYIAFLIIIFCGEICGGAVAIAYKDKIVEKLQDILNEQLDDQLDQNLTTPHYYNPGPTNSSCYTSDVGWLWDWAQITFTCCGIYNNQDYKNRLTIAYNFQKMCPGLTNAYLPASCCPLKSPNDFGDFHKTPDNQYDSQKLVECASPYSKGCYESIVDKVGHYAPVLIGIGIGFAMLELFGIIFAVCLCRNTGDD